MPKKTTKCGFQRFDVTLNDSANAPKPVSRLKKFNTAESSDVRGSWDDDDEEDFDLVEQNNEDGTKNLVFRKKKKRSKSEQNLDDRPGVVYPEIIWYFISRYLKPEQIGTFAAINRTTYAIVNSESFWRKLYRKYCENRGRLPQVLQMENNCSTYGLQQRVIRALYYTYDVFNKRVANPDTCKNTPHQLVKMQCVNMWYYKGHSYWSVCFKFKKPSPFPAIKADNFDVMEELSRIDVNNERNKQILEVTCHGFVEVPQPVMGMTLTKLNVFLAQGFRHQRLHLGFNFGPYMSHDIQPERFLVFDTVVNIAVLDWWHPKYPIDNNTLRINKKMDNDEDIPVLETDFFSDTNVLY